MGHSVVFSVLFGSASLMGLASPTDVSYKVRQTYYAGGKWKNTTDHGVLTVTGAEVNYSVFPNAARSGNPKRRYSMSCRTFPATTNFANAIEVKAWVGAIFHADEKGLKVTTILRGIQDACASQLAGAEKAEAERSSRAAAEYEKERGRRFEEVKEANAKKAVDFRNGVTQAWHATEEREPFSSIRGEFDLGAADSRQWNTTLQLPDAARCALFKTPSQSATAVPLWTYACQFSRATEASGPERFDTYERIVQTVQSALNTAFQPDEAPGVNQVFFSQASKPDWRFVVTKIGDGSRVLVWITPRLSTRALPFGSAIPSPDLTIKEEIEKIRNGSHSPIPSSQRSSTTPSAGLGGRTTMTVRNSTQYELSVYFDGPVSRSLSLAPGASQTVDLAPGVFHVAGRASASNVLPFYGDDTYQGSAQYSLNFYIGR